MSHEITFWKGNTHHNEAKKEQKREGGTESEAELQVMLLGTFTPFKQTKLEWGRLKKNNVKMPAKSSSKIITHPSE